MKPTQTYNGYGNFGQPKRQKDYSKIILLVLAVIFCIICAVGCKNMAYNKVSSDTEISARNKKLLIGICDRQFPQLPPTVIEGKTIIKTDTVSHTDTLTQTVNNETIKYVYKTNTVTIERTKTDTVVKTNVFQLTACNDEKRALEKTVDKLQNENDTFVKGSKRLKMKAWLGWIAFGAAVSLYLLKKIYLK